MICPLQKIPNGWNGYANVYTKRLDLVGGNKGFRFQQFFKEHKNINTLVAFSNPGAHTFHSLSRTLSNGEEKSPNADSRKMKLLFLEQSMPTNPYTEARRKLYLNQDNIKVIQAPFWQQMIRFLYFKFFGGKRYTTLGIGGHIDLNNSNPYWEVFKEVGFNFENKNVFHLFPIASGNMADCFLGEGSKSTIRKHHLVGVTTGGKRTFNYLNFKYRAKKHISLYRPLEYSYEDYKKKAKEFYAHSGFWLDPTHTIHLLDILDQELLPKDAVIVLWITCPLVEKLYD